VIDHFFSRPDHVPVARWRVGRVGRWSRPLVSGSALSTAKHRTGTSRPILPLPLPNSSSLPSTTTTSPLPLASSFPSLCHHHLTATIIFSPRTAAVELPVAVLICRRSRSQEGHGRSGSSSSAYRQHTLGYLSSSVTGSCQASSSFQGNPPWLPSDKSHGGSPTPDFQPFYQTPRVKCL
jgi:hypothetical protein